MLSNCESVYRAIAIGTYRINLRQNSSNENIINGKKKVVIRKKETAGEINNTVYIELYLRVTERRLKILLRTKTKKKKKRKIQLLINH